MFDGVLFDLDGTLADTALDLTIALNFVLALKNKAPLDYKTVRPFAAFGSKKLMELGFGEDTDIELRAKLLDYYEANVAVETRLFSGIKTILETLKRQSVPFGIVTNKPKRFTEPLIRALKISTPCIISGDTCTHSKPHPEPILTACKILNTNPKNTLFVGDSSIDVKSANAAKTPIIIAKYGYLTEKTKEINRWDIFGTIEKPLDLLGYL